jgi:hypothetical protein
MHVVIFLERFSEYCICTLLYFCFCMLVYMMEIGGGASYSRIGCVVKEEKRGCEERHQRLLGY